MRHTYYVTSSYILCHIIITCLSLSANTCVAQTRKNSSLPRGRTEQKKKKFRTKPLPGRERIPLCHEIDREKKTKKIRRPDEKELFSVRECMQGDGKWTKNTQKHVWKQKKQKKIRQPDEKELFSVRECMQGDGKRTQNTQKHVKHTKTC